MLSQYVGWGGLADAFDPNKENWATEYAELKGLLSEDEYAAARASSTLNAHYTSPTVIRSIYDAVERMGFRSGNILEPSMGVGNFFGMLPDTMQDSRLYGVELDSITGRIAKNCTRRLTLPLPALRPPTAVIFMTLLWAMFLSASTKSTTRRTTSWDFPSTTTFSQSHRPRSGRAAYRCVCHQPLHHGQQGQHRPQAHGRSCRFAGCHPSAQQCVQCQRRHRCCRTSSFCKNVTAPSNIEPAWVQLGKTEDGFTINQYFVDHPEMVLGNLELESTQYGHDLTVAPIEGRALQTSLPKRCSTSRAITLR